MAIIERLSRNKTFSYLVITPLLYSELLQLAWNSPSTNAQHLVCGSLKPVLPGCSRALREGDDERLQAGDEGRRVRLQPDPGFVCEREASVV